MRELTVWNGKQVGLDRLVRRNADQSVVLIGFQKQGNLGIGYLAAALNQHAYRVEIVDFEQEPSIILDVITRTQPILVGLSLIFQFYAPQFASLARYLRENDVNCHFTIGGHFPSLSYEQTLEIIPDVDSVVRFEGEITLLELADCLSTGSEWHEIDGLAYRKLGQIVTNPLRPLIHDLDALPHPVRDFKPMAVLGRNIMPILASRGCARTCSFCSIHTFYRSVPGKVVRIRKPVNVVQEMKLLYEQRDISVFLFQDDDFPVFGPAWRRWALELVDELYRQNLAGHVIWKINCRADAVERELFMRMRDAGLYLVYMGLESGTEDGLDVLHKEITVEENLQAVDTLKELGLMFQYGFMLFDPSSTFESVRDNIKFLRRVVGDGSAAATFCRMLPYDGTPIKDELKRSGRLKGDVCDPNYDFLDPSLERYFYELHDLLNIAGWIHGVRSLSPQLDWAWHEITVLQRLFPPLEGGKTYIEVLRSITKSGNDLLFEAVESLADSFQDRGGTARTAAALELQCQRLLGDLQRERNDFIGRHQQVLLEVLGKHLDQECVTTG
jgi:radical SAM superfamily enzyme YgiQ (UPF0313 family)